MAMTSFDEPNWPDKLRMYDAVSCQHILRTPGNNCIYSLCRKFICNDLNSSGVNRSGFYFNMASKISKGYGRRHAPMNNLIRLFCQLKLLYGRGHEISPV